MNDDDLRALLRDADPGRGQQPLDDARIRRIVAAAERDGLGGTGEPAPRRRRRLFAGASIGAAATAAAGLLIAGLVATPAVQAPGPSETSASCAPTSVESLRDSDTAYEATAITVVGDDVTLEVTRVFAGSPGRTLTVPQQHDPANPDGAGLFVAGESYLIASADEYISDCDSGPATDALRQIYARAFPSPTTR
ncbi:hypothetical protein QE418_001792 [Microbacterium testaceum]|uniref:hypothetical protein n=1 Tax=Microbacterium TaxID=33882 RepID=UPI001AE7DA50|nr:MULTISPECIES: hypothetical protein [Microbacterium]MDQ1112344.1 hypothetical protein [Microbacterium testaceum]MDR6097118.1 hypothetical protein [Microbacterium sp. SORGH_AS_0454]WAC69740.1 hypothetical protein OVA17_03335 [Microbacterium sp. SL75]